MKIFNLSCSIAVFILFRSLGNMFVSGQQRHRIRKITVAGRVTTFASGGSIGKILKIFIFLLPVITVYSQDNTPPNISYHIPPAFPAGTYVNYPLSNTGGSVHQAGYVGRIAGNISVPIGSNMTGSAVDAGLGEITAMASDGQGGFYLFDAAVYRMYHISAGGDISFVAGDGVDRVKDGVGASASLGYMMGMATDGLGNIYFSDHNREVVRKITPSGVVSTIAGGIGQEGYVDGPGALARFDGPGAIAVDGANNIYVCDIENARVRMITPSGMVSTLAGNGSSSSIDGPAATASLDLYALSRANGIAVAADGNVYVSEYSRGVIRKITPDGTVSTYAGLRQGASGAPRSGPALSIRLEDPSSLSIDRNTGDLYVINSIDGIITRIDAETGMATTVVGGGSMSVQEGAPLEVGYSSAEGLLCLEDGSLVIEDMGSGGTYRSCLYRYEKKSLSVEPALPAGLALSTLGDIYGQVLSTIPSKDYTVTAYNPWGSHSYTVSFAIVPAGSVPDPNTMLAASSTQNYIIESTARRPGLTVSQIGTAAVGEANHTVQYFEGLGRPLQTVQWQASPKGKDIIQHIEYDGFGRKSHRYLLYADSSSDDGSYKPNTKTKQENYYAISGSWDAHVKKTPTPYAVTVFENSPLNRVKEQGAPGDIWQPAANRTASAGRTVVSEYGTNVTAQPDAVKLWKIETNGATGTTDYAAGRLYKTVVKDENWMSGKGGTVEEYKDFEDRVVLKRIWEMESKKLETYYVYDDFGDLRYIIPPAVTQTNFTEAAADPVFDKYIYAYRYDRRRRLVEKKIPGKGWEWTVYNKNNLPIMTQDSVQRAKNPREWSYTKYDAFSRVVQTGTLTAAYTTQAAAQSAADSHATATNKHWESRGLNVTQYSNVSFPTANLSRRTVNYYDNYNKFMGTVDTVQLAPRGITRTPKVHSLLTGSRVYTDSATDSLLTVYYYDERGRVIQTASRNHLGGKDIVTNTYLFTGEVETNKREHWTSLTTLPTTTILTTNIYDHVGRLVETKKKVNSQAEIIQSQLAYNEIGQLKEKKLHVSGSNAMQEVVYSYNERGWTTSINNPSAVTDKRRFGVTLNYANNPQTYNGNIGSVQWNTKVSGSQTQTPLQTYTYTYDKLNRLKKAAYSGATNKANWFNEELAYDVMGNIDTLRRTNGGTSWYNHFKYSYAGNRLNSVTDVGSANRGNSFTYDVNGNAKTNTRLGITDIEYNYLNLPKKFVKGSQQLTYTYDATGKKLKKTLGSAVTDYVDGIQYRNGVLEFIQTEEGRILPSGSSFVYEYFLKDHLGNTRAIVDHTGAVKQIQDYYAFGMEMNTGAGLNSASNHYKYNGKEKQVELGLDQLDYGARFYDPEIGRWNVVDPITDIDWEFFRKELFLTEFDDNELNDEGDYKISHNISQYSYVLNNPISYIDLYGFDSLRVIELSPVEVTRSLINENFYFLNQTSNNSDANRNMNLWGPALIGVTTEIPKSWLGLPRTGTSGTNLLSYTMGKTFRKEFPKRRITGYTKTGKPIKTKVIGRFLGRWGTKFLGPAGYAITVYDIVKPIEISDRYEKVLTPRDNTSLKIE